ncbi:MAG: hypothetical protein DRG25_05025 [Deltaproteobacteria bacterium]|nr:MAG: hypothetical protein DRG25_05025 [Deltaproteobacteria bacterium]
MWSCRTWVLPSFPTRSPLESGAIEGEIGKDVDLFLHQSPVGEGKKGDSRYPEYHCPIWQWESGGH